MPEQVGPSTEHRVQVRRLVWTHDGWPLVSPQPWAGPGRENDDTTAWPVSPAVFGGTWTYELTNTEIVDPSAMHVVEQTRDSTATLFACHPKHSAAQRIVAHFRLVGH